MKLILLTISSLIYANCNYINNSDLKNLCKAETNNSMYCNYIKNSDDKNFCIGITKDYNYCNYIKNRDKREYCKSKSKG